MQVMSVKTRLSTASALVRRRLALQLLVGFTGSLEYFTMVPDDSATRACLPGGPKEAGRGHATQFSLRSCSATKPELNLAGLQHARTSALYTQTLH
jgi:hypothetical protein